MFTTAIRLEIEKKVRERSRENDERDAGSDRFEGAHVPASPANEYEKSDRYRLVDPLFRLDEIERLLPAPGR